MYKKSAKTGVVINTDDFSEYRIRRESVKETMRARQEAKEAKSEVAHVRAELSEIKDLLKSLLNEKK